MREKKKPKTWEFLFTFGISVWDLYIENNANRGLGFQSFCLEFATHVCSEEFIW